MGRADFLNLGDWNTQCYQCGRKRKASTMKKHWQGYWVCSEHWEPRHPQDFVRNVTDNMTPPWSQPQPAPQFRLAFGMLDSMSFTDETEFTLIRTREIFDNISFSESLIEFQGSAADDSFAMSESFEVSATTNVSETTTFTDTMSYTIYTETQINGSALNVWALNASHFSTIISNINDTFSTSESFIVGGTTTVTPTDTITWSDAPISSFTKSVTDSISTSETHSVSFTANISDGIIVTDLPVLSLISPSQINGDLLNGASLNAN